MAFGLAATLSDRGNSEAGSSRAIPTSLPQPVPSSILYERVWERAPLGADDFVVSADEKTSIQAWRRKQPTLPPTPNRPTKVEHEYFRKMPGATWLLGTFVAPGSLAAVKSRTGLAPVERLVGEVMYQEPYKSGRRIFWIMDNCSAHRSRKAVDRFRAQRRPREIYFSIVQRGVLTRNDFPSLAELEQRLLAFQCHYERMASPFKWTFTRRDLQILLAKIDAKRLAPAA